MSSEDLCCLCCLPIVTEVKNVYNALNLERACDCKAVLDHVSTPTTSGVFRTSMGIRTGPDAIFDFGLGCNGTPYTYSLYLSLYLLISRSLFFIRWCPRWCLPRRGIMELLLLW